MTTPKGTAADSRSSADGESRSGRGFGCWRRAWPYAAAGILATAAVLHALLWQTGYAVSKTLPVQVRVFDADTGAPLSNAFVVLFRAAEFPRENLESLAAIVDLQVDDDRKEAVTNADGRVNFRWEFRAIVGRNILGTHGSIVEDTWVRVAPSGYCAVIVPLDGQSLQRRDYQDESPVMVTVLLQGNAGTRAAGKP